MSKSKPIVSHSGPTFAIWRKCDFQVHSPRDPNWQGPRPVGVGESRTGGGKASDLDVDAARKAWAKSFVEALVARGISAVAVTDHHEMVMVPYIQQELASRASTDSPVDIWLFPGMEITAKGGVQSLLLFDHDLEEKWWTQAQGALGIAHADIDASASKGKGVTPLDISYPEIQKRLDAIEGLRGRFVVLPNMSDGGNHTCVKQGGHADFKHMPYVGGYLDRGQTATTLGAKARNRIGGEDENWGNRKFYPIPTSDARESDFSALGSNNAWIKLAVPTAEAIRQAFLGHESRIAIDVPQTTSLHVRSVTLKGTKIITDGTYALSPELNVLIGGRGAGKSAFLEYLAFAIGRSAHDLNKDDYSENERLRSLIADTMIGPSASIEAIIEQDGAVFSVGRAARNAFEPTLTYPSGERVQVSAAEIRKMFPAVVYSQGELSEIGKKAGGAARFHELLQFVDPDSLIESRKLSETIEKRRGDVASKLRALIEYWNIEDQIGALRRSLVATDERIKALTATLPKLEMAEQAILDEFDKASAFDDVQIRAVGHAEQMQTEIDAVFDALGKARDVPSFSSEAAKSLSIAYGEYYAAATVGLRVLQAKTKESLGKLDKARKGWETEFQIAKAKRDKVLEKLGTHKNITRQINVLQDERKAASADLAKLQSKLEKAANAQQQFDTAIEQLWSTVEAFSARTTAWAKQVEALSQQKIVVDVSADGNVQSLREALDAVAKGTGSQEAARNQNLDNALVDDSAKTVFARLRAEAHALMRWKTQKSIRQGESPSTQRLQEILGATKHIEETIPLVFDAERLEHLATAIPRPRVSLSYDDGKQKISFDKASDGQRASALLMMLLEQQGGPLIVDQPEGDLDNKVVMDITRALHRAKTHRQLVFASHNANIVVNGSAEQVCLAEPDGTGLRLLENRGAIDETKVREAITSTMEGGEKAFRDRQQKYGY